ncbi:hypothetical protein ACFYWO_01385 [Streptomyces sp. NPDC002932]|uniref:hypothetical protein n=1 Tax=Streptomyces sp. NPDC002932 TaxID=3364672 RepID=UPI003693D16D
MNTVASAEPSFLMLARRLLHQPSEEDFQAEPMILGRLVHPSLVSDEVQHVLNGLLGQLGQPSQYGGGAHGPDVRWRADSHTVILDAGRDGRLRLSARRTPALDDSEAERFQSCATRRPQSEGGRLPYLWRYQRSGPFRPAPAAPVAQDWAQLHCALEELLRAWGHHLEVLVGDEDAGFAIDHGDGQLTLMVSPREDVALFGDRRDGTGRDADRLAVMTARGWHGFSPVLSSWEAYFDRTPAGAAAAARLVVTELKARGVPTPSDLRLIRATLGTGGGRLDIPGAGVAVGAFN